MHSDLGHIIHNISDYLVKKNILKMEKKLIIMVSYRGGGIHISITCL